MGYLIDTSVVIALERRRLSLEQIKALLPAQSTAMAAITASELLAGVLRGQDSVRRRQRSAFIEWVLAELEVIPFDLLIARRHAELTAALVSGGSMIGAHDAQIAATALVTGDTVLTDNLRDFNRVPALAVLQPPWI